MKQHITIEQLNELSEKGKEKLREWWEPQEGDKATTLLTRDLKTYEVISCYLGITNLELSKKYSDCLPLLSIGQMIEFLEENEVDWINEVFSVDYSWEISYSRFVDDLNSGLWKLVKEVLEN